MSSPIPPSPAPGEVLASQAQDDDNNTVDNSFGDILSQFEQSHQPDDDSPGAVQGTVVAITDEWVLVDIGRKNDGVLATEKVRDGEGNITVKKGDVLSLSVVQRDDMGNFLLNTIHVEKPKDWDALELAFNEKRVIQAKVVEVVKGGLRIDTGAGVRAFMPASRSGTRDQIEMAKLVGQQIECRITKLEKEKEDVVVDRRAVIEELAEEAKRKTMDALAEGQVLNGKIRTLVEYGAFVDLGGVDGLLHVGDMSWHHVGKPGDLVNVGDAVEVKILKINRETKKISLGMKQLVPDPWTLAASKYSAGQRVQGKVVRLTDFGAFVELEPGVDGMVHVSEMSWTKKIRKPGDVLKIGDVVDVQVLEVKAADKRIALGLKQALGDPWDDVEKKFPVGTVLEAPITSVAKFGAFVDVGDGIEGMIHVGDITNEKRIEHPKDVLSVGQTVKAMVIEIDRERRRLRMGMKQLEPTKTDEFIAAHTVGETVTGRVIESHAERCKVDLGEGVFAQCRLKPAPAPEAPAAAPTGPKADVGALSAMLSSRWKTGPAATGAGPANDGPKPGQVRSFKITLIDAANKKIELELA
jgi:small subunit ribosomal protein S1